MSGPGRGRAASLHAHIKNKKRVLEDMGFSFEAIDGIPWSRFQNIVQVDNYCRTAINDYLDNTK